MVGTTLDFDHYVSEVADLLGVEIGRKHMEWNMLRNIWLTEKGEIRNYLFATDTRKTTNNVLPWKNSTTVPKLTQIRDNLHANYMAAMFPNDKWLRWEGEDEDDEIEAKRKAIESYMMTKLRQSRADVEISKLVLDYIDYGNCFATSEWTDNSITDDDGNTVRGYVGPKIVRISPYDITFNPLAPDFQSSPKIIRKLTNLGELKRMLDKMAQNDPRRAEIQKALDKSIATRKAVAGLDPADILKTASYAIDGFTNVRHYFGSDYCEILTFYGDIYDVNNEELLTNRKISIIDRMFVFENIFNPDWINGPGIFHAGWRQRPDNLYAMGPLDNLVGMQYRIDHLENLKADAFDMIAFPMLKIKGFVEDFNYAPGERILVSEEGDVEFMHPDTTALTADNQIAELERRMEEMAGAPREAMGIRTPGEKTKFEVQTLDNAASRIFTSKVTHFERVFFEPLLNYMLMVSRQNMSSVDVTRTLDSSIDAVIFSKVTKDDIIANGLLRPIGARHFAYRANLLQNIIGLTNSSVANDPAVKVHLSGKKLAKLLEELTDLDEFKIYGDNVRIFEQAETQQLMNNASEHVDTASITPPGILPHDQQQPPPGANQILTDQVGQARLQNLNLRNAQALNSANA